MIKQTEEFVKDILANAEKGHDWQHIARVRANALKILKTEPGAKPEVVELAALLHDIADRKFNNNDEQAGPLLAKRHLKSINCSEEIIEKVVYIIQNVSYAGGRIVLDPTLELTIVQDADKLDAMGAVGIARCFHYGGYKNREIYNEAIPPQLSMTEQEYKNSTGPSFNHLFEKIMKLPDLMHTETGRKMAIERHKFLKTFIKQFEAEVSADSLYIS